MGEVSGEAETKTAICEITNTSGRVFPVYGAVTLTQEVTSITFVYSQQQEA